MKKHLLKILNNSEIADKIFELQLESEKPLADFLPGNFLHIKCSDGLDPLLRRPMSICDISDDKKLLTVLYRKEGIGTSLLSQKTKNEIIDVLAPLGKEFPIENVSNNKKIFIVGGGIGVPPLYYLSRILKQSFEVEIKSFLGFNSKKDVFYKENFSKLGETVVATMDGSSGHKGFVTDLINEDFDFLFSCGPNQMFKTMQKIINKSKAAYISVEERMGCGVGACLACVCKTNPEAGFEKSFVRSCTEGPVFRLHDIVFE